MPAPPATTTTFTAATCIGPATTTSSIDPATSPARGVAPCPARSSDWFGEVRAALIAGLDVLTPLVCAGCGAQGAAVCEECGAALHAPLIRSDGGARELAGTGLPVWSTAEYTGGTRSLVLAWKRGREDVAAAVEEAGREMADRWLAVAEDVPRRVVVVPAPSGWRRRARGLLVARNLAGWIAAGLEGGGVRARVADVLRRRGRGPGHLAGLSAAARARARGHAVRLVRPLPSVPVLLVDDVLTTGATLAACVDAIEAGPWREAPARERKVVGALTLAATPARSRT